MGNVVQFSKPDPLIWVCNCGCSTFRLLSTGLTECASCGNIGCDNAEWFEELPEPATEPKTLLPETKVISLTGSPAAAIRTMMSRVDPEKTVALIVIAENGQVNTWDGIDTEDRREWLERRFDDARACLTALISKDGN